MSNDFEGLHPRANDGKFTEKTHSEPPAGTGALAPETRVQDRERVAEMMSESINGWYSCVTQAVRYLSEETLNHPNDADKALAVATRRYVKDPTRNDTTWRDELSEDEAIDSAQDALRRATSGTEGELWELFQPDEEENAALARVLPTNDCQESARMYLAAIKKLYGESDEEEDFLIFLRDEGVTRPQDEDSYEGQEYRQFLRDEHR